LHKSIRWREILSKYEEVNNDVAVSECGNDVISSVIRRRMRERGGIQIFSVRNHLVWLRERNHLFSKRSLAPGQ
jgi:hypothetical protein